MQELYYFPHNYYVNQLRIFLTRKKSFFLFRRLLLLDFIRSYLKLKDALIAWLCQPRLKLDFLACLYCR